MSDELRRIMDEQTAAQNAKQQEELARQRKNTQRRKRLIDEFVALMRDNSIAPIPVFELTHTEDVNHYEKEGVIIKTRRLVGIETRMHYRPSGLGAWIIVGYSVNPHDHVTQGLAVTTDGKLVHTGTTTTFVGPDPLSWYRRYDRPEKWATTRHGLPRGEPVFLGVSEDLTETSQYYGVWDGTRHVSYPDDALPGLLATRARDLLMT
jgi:hypothetical protein